MFDLPGALHNLEEVCHMENGRRAKLNMVQPMSGFQTHRLLDIIALVQRVDLVPSAYRS